MTPLHRSDGSAHHFADGADHALGLELGERLLVLLVVPVDVAALMDSGRGPEELVQPLLEQRIFAPVLLGDRLTWRTGRMCIKAGTAAIISLVPPSRVMRRFTTPWWHVMKSG